MKKKPGLASVGGFGRKKKGPSSKKKRGGKKRGGGIKYDPLAPLLKKRLNKEMRAAEHLEFGPLSRQLAREEAASRYRETTELPTWYQGYQNTLAQLRGETQGANAAMMNRVQSATQQAGTQDAANRDAMMARLAKDAQLRGTALDPSIERGQVDAEAARANSSNTILGVLGGQGQNYSNYLASRQAAAGMGLQEARDRELDRLREIYADQRELAAKRGSFRNEFRRTSREDERKWWLEKQALKPKPMSGYDKAIIKQAKLGVKRAKVTGKAGIKQAQINKKPGRTTVVSKYPGRGKGKRGKKPKKIGSGKP